MYDIFIAFFNAFINFTQHSFLNWLIMVPAIFVACLGVFSLIPGKS